MQVCQGLIRQSPDYRRGWAWGIQAQGLSGAWSLVSATGEGAPGQQGYIQVPALTSELGKAKLVEGAKGR